MAEVEIRVTNGLRKLELKGANDRRGSLVHSPGEKVASGEGSRSQPASECLTFLSVALNLRSRGCSKEIDGNVQNAIQELLLKTIALGGEGRRI